MAIEKQTYLNEILIRMKRDGSIAGAHQVHNDILVDTASGEILSERAGLAKPLDPADVGDLVGAAFAAATAQIAGLEARLADLTQERDALAAQSRTAAQAVPEL